MKALIFLLLSPLGALMAISAAAQSIAVADDDSCIAVYSEYVERRLLRVHFDQTAKKVAFSPFGPPGIEKFAVAPKGAFVVYAGIPGSGFEQTPHLFLLDAAGKPVGKPVPSPIGAVAELAVSPKGDLVAASSEGGWISLFAVERTGQALRLHARATFGVSPGTYTYAFRPDGSIVTLTDDLVAIFRSPAGVIQRILDLEAINGSPASSGKPLASGSGLVPTGSGRSPIDGSGAFRLRWSPRGDRFALISGMGPVFVTIFDATGRRLNSATDLWGTEVEYIEGGDAAIVSGMNSPAVVRMTGLATKPFGGPYDSWPRFVALSGGRRVTFQYGDSVSLWSSDGKQLIAPTGFENYTFDAAAAGADNEAIVSAARGGWIDLFTKQGEFVRRVQFGLGRAGDVAVSADGTAVVAYNGGEISTLIRPMAKTWRAAFEHQFVAIAGNGSRVVAAGPDNTLRIWPRDGGEPTTYKLEADGNTSGRPAGLAVSSEGDIIVVADERAAAWFAWPLDGKFRRVALPGEPRVVVPLAEGFVFGLADGRVVRLGRDGTPEGEPIKGSEYGFGRITIADDGQSFMVVEGDQASVRQLDWNGRVLAGPFRISHPERIKGFFSSLAERG